MQNSILEYEQKEEKQTEIQTENLNKVLEKFSNANGLTLKQSLILELFTRGYSNEEIADDLKISKKTVANHIRILYRNVNCSSSRELLSKVINYIIIDQLNKNKTTKIIISKNEIMHQGENNVG